MTARLFISYRASDGTDNATSLARDLDGLARRSEAAAGGAAFEHGTLPGAIAADERRILGRLWLRGEQAERVVDLRPDR